MIEIENFLEFPESIIDHSKTAAYQDETNPVDGVVYPHICKEIPDRIKNDIIFNLTHKVLARAPKDPFIFMRKSPKGAPVTHKYHTDNCMGRYSMMIYLQNNPDAGTGLAVHKDLSVTRAPYNDELLKITIEDCNDDSKWQVYKRAKMAKNKAVIFDSDLFHVALPIGGFGEGTESRVVLTCFFS